MRSSVSTLARLAALALSAPLLAGCGGSEGAGRPPASPAAPSAAVSAPSPAVAPARAAGCAEDETAHFEPLAFVEGDVEGARRRALAEGKLVLVEAWAPWCHTCLSMKNFVFRSAEAQLLACDVVPVAVDTDRPESAAFLERYEVGVWPTIYLLDPADGEVIDLWSGAASVTELRDFVDRGVRALSARRSPGSDEAGLALALTLASARQAHARRDWPAARAGYARYVKEGGVIAPARSEALLGWLSVLRKAGDFQACAELGADHAPAVRGAALPADFAGMTLACAARLPKGSAARIRAENAAVGRLLEITERPPEGASADDRADALAILGDALASLGDLEEARRVYGRRLTLLEAAAKSAPGPEAAQTFDYALAATYLALGRGPDAVRMLEARERELPASYEAPARLSAVLVKLGRLEAAHAAIERAITRAYGPRRLDYLRQRADLEAKLGRRDAERASLREEIAGHLALPEAQARPAKLAEARARLAEAEGRARPGVQAGAEGP